MVTAIEEMRKRKAQGIAFLGSVREGEGKVRAFVDANMRYLSPREVQYMNEFRWRIDALYKTAAANYLSDPLTYPVAWRALKAEINECIAYLLPVIQSRRSASASTAFRF